ncbi:MAG TPA: hypothetical protein VGF87_06395 [Acidimicrobiales bacterium]
MKLLDEIGRGPWVLQRPPVADVVEGGVAGVEHLGDLAGPFAAAEGVGGVMDDRARGKGGLQASFQSA